MADLAPRNINELHEAQASFGDRVADKMAAVVGSWTFILIQATLLLLWVLWNLH